MIENVIINDSKWCDADVKALFDLEDVVFANSNTIEHLMKELGIFPSISKARQAGRVGKIPEGWTENFKASKKFRLWIWNPTE